MRQITNSYQAMRVATESLSALQAAIFDAQCGDCWGGMTEGSEEQETFAKEVASDAATWTREALEHALLKSLLNWRSDAARLCAMRRALSLPQLRADVYCEELNRLQERAHEAIKARKAAL